jgi:hypothetical protein
VLAHEAFYLYRGYHIIMLPFATPCPVGLIPLFGDFHLKTAEFVAELVGQRQRGIEPQPAGLEERLHQRTEQALADPPAHGARLPRPPIPAPGTAPGGLQGEETGTNRGLIPGLGFGYAGTDHGR